MSLPEISNHRTLIHIVSALRDQGRHQGHRSLLALENAPEGWLANFSVRYGFHYLPADLSMDRADCINGILGREFHYLTHETRDNLDLGILAAAAGTVKAGGILLLGLPFSSCDTGVPAGHRSVTPRFNQRLSLQLNQLLEAHPLTVRRFDARQLAAIPDGESVQSFALRGIELQSPQASSARDVETLVTSAARDEQDALLARACDHLKQHRQACIVITGRRGRGKSALLGRIARCLQENQRSLAITATRRSALSSVESQFSAIDFLPPADAVRSGCSALLVDEAASLPIDMLMHYLQHHDHVIYSTTIEGYEQAGRAFEIRFMEMLSRQSRALLLLCPDTAWRWAAGDPLEEFMDNVLMSRPQTRAVTNGGGEPRIRRLDRNTLARDEPLFRSVYSLLRDNHYQTTTNDISHLLDAPGLQIWVLEEQQTILAAMLLALEGNIAAHLHDAVVSKQRRLPHHLLPQLLAQSSNEALALSKGIARVIRLAVVPERRRQGLGSRLLNEVISTFALTENAVDAIGASFASDPANLGFWSGNGFALFHTGYRRNPRTGERAVAMLRSWREDMAGTLALAARIHDDNQQWLLEQSGSTQTDPMDLPLLQRFARKERSLIDTYAALSRLAREQSLTLTGPPGITKRQHEAQLRAWVSRVLQLD